MSQRKLLLYLRYIVCIAGAFFLSSSILLGQSNGTLADRIQTILRRPECAHSTLGVESYSLDRKGRTGALHFIASEHDLQYGLKQPWTSLCLDAGELSLDGSLFEPHTHPRAFGAMPRFLGHYVRDLQLVPIEQAVRKMTSLPAQHQRLRNRGLLKEGCFVDITIFDPATIRDTALCQSGTGFRRGEVCLCKWRTGI